MYKHARKHLDLATGHWARGRWKTASLFDWGLHAPEKQIAFVREAARLSLGHQPSAHFPIPFPGTPQTDHNTAQFVLDHSAKSRSHFVEKLGQNKHAAGFADAIGDFVSKAASKMPSWAIKSGKYIAKNMPTITKYAYALSNVSGIVAPIGTAAGWWGQEHGQAIVDIADAVKSATKPGAKPKALAI